MNVTTAVTKVATRMTETGLLSGAGTTATTASSGSG